MEAVIASLFTAVDEIATYDGRGLPAGAAARIERGLHLLRKANLPAEDIRRAEALSIGVQKLMMLLPRRELVSDWTLLVLKRRLAADCWTWIRDLPLAIAR